MKLPVRFDEFKEETNETLERIEDNLGTGSRRLDSLRGYALEDVMASRLRQRLGRLFDLKRVRVIWQARHLVQALEEKRELPRLTRRRAG